MARRKTNTLMAQSVDIDILQETLQREFCPPLDTSLLAALLADVNVEEETAVSAFREMLRQLANVAETQLATDSAILPTNENHLDAFDDREETLNNQTSEYTSEYSSSYSGRANENYTRPIDVNRDHFNSPFGFLQAALPHIPAERLLSALYDGDSENGEEKEVDMEAIVARILSDEYIRELQERGLSSSTSDSGFGSEEGDWELINTKTQSKQKTKKVKAATKKIALGSLPTSYNRASSSSKVRQIEETGDPWTALTSLATYLAALMPKHLPPFFLSYLHSPEWGSPYVAVCAALRSVRINDYGEAGDEDGKDDDTGNDEEYSETLFALLEVLLPSCQNADRVVMHTQLALRATEGSGEDSLELVGLLEQLYDEHASMTLDNIKIGTGVYHSPLRENISSSTVIPPVKSIASSSSSTLPIKTSPAKPKPKPTTNANAWKEVPIRSKPQSTTHPPPPFYSQRHKLHPSDKRDVNGIPKQSPFRNRNRDGAGEIQMGLSHGKVNGKRIISAGEYARKRDEALREASRMWQRGKGSSYGGQVAVFFAERAREFQELARKEALEGARGMVEAKRVGSNKPDTIDLHGTTVVEAIDIVRGILARSKHKGKNANGHHHGLGSAEYPLKVITGKGTHSAGRVGVLGPAVKNALQEEGWIVGTWDAGLIVRGKR